jgi:hypothetical protein
MFEDPRSTNYIQSFAVTKIFGELSFLISGVRNQCHHKNDVGECVLQVEIKFDIEGESRIYMVCSPCGTTALRQA